MNKSPDTLEFLLTCLEKLAAAVARLHHSTPFVEALRAVPGGEPHAKALKAHLDGLRPLLWDSIAHVKAELDKLSSKG